MRAAALCLLVVLGGCSTPDPDWAKPCAQQRAPSLEVGTGAAEFLPINDGGVSIEVDPSGTYLWLAVSCRGLGPDVTVSCSATDATSGSVVATGAGQPVQLTYNRATDRDEAGGIVASVVNPAAAQQLVGSTVILAAQAVGCGRTAQSQVSTKIAGFDATSCQGCLYAACGGQLALCDADCTSIQACLDSTCANLSALASPDEVTCQAYCQSLHPKGKAAHVALVSCVASSACQPPCNGYSIDYDACVAAQNTGLCANALVACTASSDCQAFKTCVTSCATFADCQRCATNHAAGEALFEAYEWCVERSCLTLGWLPHI